MKVQFTPPIANICDAVTVYTTHWGMP